MEKIQVKHFGNEGEGRFREIPSCPPNMRVAPQMPPNSETWRRHWVFVRLLDRGAQIFSRIRLLPAKFGFSYIVNA